MARPQPAMTIISRLSFHETLPGPARTWSDPSSRARPAALCRSSEGALPATGTAADPRERDVAQYGIGEVESHDVSRRVPAEAERLHAALKRIAIDRSEFDGRSIVQVNRQPARRGFDAQL